jgi:hypothetical protein
MYLARRLEIELGEHGPVVPHAPIANVLQQAPAADRGT